MLPPLPLAPPSIAAAAGAPGILSVVRSHPLQPQPYTGMVQIVSGEIAEDLATYMAESEQTNSALALGVAINRDCSVSAAGGYLVQVRHGAGWGEAAPRAGALSGCVCEQPRMV
jgi:molecular chaperone Hsp33